MRLYVASRITIYIIIKSTKFFLDSFRNPLIRCKHREAIEIRTLAAHKRKSIISP